jgi:16S rRNA (guanine527-N7)-methyltransferase
MHPARIAELLQPFLSPIQNPCHSAVPSPAPNLCHSEPGQRPGESLPRGARRREPAVPAVLSATHLQSISTYIDILQHWNARINLTAIRSEEEIVTRHFGESLFAANHLFPKIYPVPPVPPVVKDVDVDVAEARSLKAEARLADLGSGAGFPGIPIKLWAPNIALTLIESNQKKATFLREVARALTFTDINIQNVRAETLPPFTFDVVTVRAVERFETILPAAARLVAPAGRLALLISSSQQEAARSTLLNVTWDPPIPIPHSQSRQLIIGRIEPKK